MEPIVLLAVVGVAVAAAGAWWVLVYNRLVGLRQHVREAWADIDVQLKRRHDLIPPLVETVRGYAAHERELLDRVVQLRNEAEQTRRVGDLARHESMLQRGLGRLFAVAEDYPQLKAGEHFLELQRELAVTEDRLAAARRFYNANVRELNTLREQFPTRLVAGAAKVAPADYFELDADAERVAPRVALD